MVRRRVGGRRVSALGALFFQACFISWFAWLPALLLGPVRGYVPYVGPTLLGLADPDFTDGTHALVSWLFVLGGYGPLVSAWGMAYRLGGVKGIRTLFQRAIYWRLDGRWYLVALAIALLLPLPAIAASRLAGVGPEQAQLPVSGWLIPLLFLAHLLTSALQEPAWRGVALPLLQLHNTAEQSSYVVGAMWTVWMLPYLLVLYAGLDVGPTLPLHFIGWAIYLLGSSVILTWLYNSTASLWLCMVYHAAALTAWVLATGYMGWHPLPQLVLGVTAWVVAVVLVRRYGTGLAAKRDGARPA